MTSCQEEEALLFSDSARVQFTSTDDYPYSFVWSDKSVTEAVVKLPIKVIGGPGDAPRKLRISQITEYDVTYEYDNKGYLVDSTVTTLENKVKKLLTKRFPCGRMDFTCETGYFLCPFQLRSGNCSGRLLNFF